MRIIRFALYLCLAAAAQAQELKVFYGLLHAHTYFSDGSGTPEQAYERAKKAGLHFFAVTEHNHAEAELGAAKDRADGILIATNPSLYEANGSVQIQRLGQAVTVKTLRQAAADASSSSFVALYGQEFSSISRGNHMNVLHVDRVLAAPNGDFRALFDDLRGLAAAPVVQLNHPDFHADLFYQGQDQKKRQQMFNDYGLDDYGSDFAMLAQETGRFVSLIELLSGPAMKQERVPHFRYGAHENDYYYYLSQGFHISPSAGHDNHYETWGDATDARMGVYASELTISGLLRAFRENRTFATEDADLAIGFFINDQPMGSTLTLDDDAELVIRATASDPTDTGATYEVTLIHGQVAPQAQGTFRKIMQADGEADTGVIGAGGTLEMRGQVASGGPEFFYVKVVQSDGDRAWSAPVWINHPRAADAGGAAGPEMFAWTRSPQSKVFHRPDCKAVQQIKPENLVQGPKPPEGRKQHACVPVEVEARHE